ncbi:hypothetical protein LOZ53_006645 [Ophidiomyces ophidiicola]|nr:hypothetical protein LOZ55_002064 [Ophidiomyces ophidiicola]KAI1980367.1 hypothetical protein LOZ53_006645 [Ophidiomyces ophidiicola]KAI1981736.1 hypothetical protein LOZ54_005542 [Ophidiomyces ophidiicola]KAI1991057.1 hypothetical protein LOZ51_004587 [Ophidiomyces ophidiicola]
MSFPPPPGFQQPPRPSSTQQQPHASLPPRPPSTSLASSAPHKQSNGSNSTGYNGFGGFQPRSVAANQTYRSRTTPASPTTYSSGASYSTPTASYSSNYQSQPQYQQPPQLYPPQSSTYYSQQQYGNSSHAQSATSQRAPYSAAQDQSTYGYGSNNRGFGHQGESSVDAETEAQIAQWQSAYMSKDENNQSAGSNNRGAAGRRDDASSATGANTGPLGNTQRFHDSSATSTPPSTTQTSTATPAPGQIGPQKTVMRSGGGQTWTDSTLLEWDPAHFRLFCGNLAGEVTDDSLLKAFSKYPSVQKARVIRDKRTEKSKGYGFVSFSDGEDYFKAAREMQGKYIGSHPVLLRRAMTEIRPVASGKGGAKNQKKGRNVHGSGAGGKDSKGGGKGSDGVQKKQSKTKGGLRVLG